jgi:hypothetical protein
MKKIGIALGALLALAGLAAAALPWYVGMETEKRFQAGISNPDITNSPFALKLVQYRRGWTHSTALHRISLKAEPDVYFDVHHDIDHLPDPRVGLVRVRSTPRWPEQVQAAADYFSKQPAMTVDTVVDDRNVGMRIASPAFSRPLLTQPGETHLGRREARCVSLASKVKLDMSMPGSLSKAAAPQPT